MCKQPGWFPCEDTITCSEREEAVCGAALLAASWRPRLLAALTCAWTPSEAPLPRPLRAQLQQRCRPLPCETDSSRCGWVGHGCGSASGHALDAFCGTAQKPFEERPPLGALQTIDGPQPRCVPDPLTPGQCKPEAQREAWLRIVCSHWCCRADPFMWWCSADPFVLLPKIHPLVCWCAVPTVTRQQES